MWIFVHVIYYSAGVGSFSLTSIARAVVAEGYNEFVSHKALISATGYVPRT